MTFVSFIDWLFAFLTPKQTMPSTDNNPQVPVEVVPPPKPAYLWDTMYNAYHSVRLICDEENLTFDQKQTLSATVWGESEFNTHAVRHNYAFKHDGTKYLASTDNGICQWNDYWHGKEITPQQAMGDPERAVRLMCTYWKRGQMRQWVAYSTGRYLQFVGKIPVQN